MSHPNFIIPEHTAVIIGEAVAGESTAVRSALEQLINSLDKSAFDIGALLHTVKSKGFYQAWGFTTFTEYVETLNIKARKAQYLTRIIDVMEQVSVARSVYEPLGVARLREITSLDPTKSWLNPENNEQIPIRDFIVGFIEKGEELSMEDLKQHIRTLKGLVGENDLTWRNLCMTRSTAENTWDPAIVLAKNHIGSVGKDDEGISKDASDGAAAEVIAISFLNDPANHVLGENFEEAA